MTKTPIVSVILPSYNHADFVTAAVESVLTQTLQDLELIVVDDGSNDGTPDIVEHIRDPRLRLVRLEKNRLRNPRNLGLSLAHGHYIAFQNSDDVWLPKKLEKQLRVMQKHQDILACFTGVDAIDENGEIKSDSWTKNGFTRKNRSNLQWLQHFFEDGNDLCITSAMVLHKELERAGGFRGALVQASDFDLWVRLAGFGQFYIVDETLTLFRDLTGSKKHTRNLSSPNIHTQNRLNIEFASILKHYTTPPISNLLPKIFPKTIPTKPATRSIRLAYLGKYAWSLDKVCHSLFADHVISQLIDDETSRKKVTEYFGAGIIQEFIKRRGNLEIRVTDRTPTQLTDQEQIINSILNSRSWKITYPLRVLGTIFRKLRDQIEKLFGH